MGTVRVCIENSIMGFQSIAITIPVYVREEGSPTRHMLISDLVVFFSAAVVAVDGKPVKLQMCDTAGQVSAAFLWSHHLTHAL